MKLADVSVSRPVLAGVLNAVLLVVGLVAFPNVGVDMFPNVEFPVVTVTAIYPGADPEAVESKVIDKLEEPLSTLSGIKELRSFALENVGQVIIRFELERDADQAAQDVRDKVAAALRELPSDLEPPVVAKFDVGAEPIISLAVAGEGSLGEVTRYAEKVVKARLQKLDGVGAIDLVGGRKRQVSVWIDPDRLASYQLTVGDLAQALGAQNLEVPGGRVESGDEELAVKTKGEVRSPEDLGAIILTSIAGAPIRVRDVARVEDGVEEERSASDLAGGKAVALVVQKQSGANTVAVAERVKREIEALRAQAPPGIKLEVPQDNSLFIAATIRDVQFDLLYGALLTVLVIALFLRDLRATLISAIALPISVVATFGFIPVMGFTFNTVTMLALALSIGILIDDAIVVIENIHRHLEMGKPPARGGARGHGRDRARGHGHHRLDPGGVPARGHDEGPGGPLHVPVRHDRELRRGGLAARLLHGHAHALLAPAAPRRRERTRPLRPARGRGARCHRAGLPALACPRAAPARPGRARRPGRLRRQYRARAHHPARGLPARRPRRAQGRVRAARRRLARACQALRRGAAARDRRRAGRDLHLHDGGRRRARPGQHRRHPRQPRGPRGARLQHARGDRAHSRPVGPAAAGRDRGRAVHAGCRLARGHARDGRAVQHPRLRSGGAAPGRERRGREAPRHGRLRRSRHGLPRRQARAGGEHRPRPRRGAGGAGGGRGHDDPHADRRPEGHGSAPGRRPHRRARAGGGLLPPPA
ncbi:MAG: efflux RND transporter permease subunit [Deltaproteobacteria bacterium]|nr:efflux RND transporter permease subunit [Deltaproteobacteria bacterium]